MSVINLDGRAIGVGSPTLVVAEIGVNHDGSVTKALELAKVAHACGADAVKLQVFHAASLMHPSSRMAEYQRRQLPSDDPIEMLRRYELSGEETARIVKAVREMGMLPIATPFSPGDMDLIERLHLSAIKIASPDVVNRPLLDLARQSHKPLLVSTGAATVDEIAATVDWLGAWKTEFALLHCVSAYPAAPEQANLCWIEELARRFECVIGYSDHTTSPVSGALAAAAGAVIVERHLTYDRAARGPDHAASSDPHQFERYVKLIREADVLRGTPGKRVLDVEQDVRTVSRQSLVLRHNVAAGDPIRAEDLTVQRPGTGVSPALIDQAVGRQAARALPAGTMLEWDMLTAA